MDKEVGGNSQRRKLPGFLGLNIKISPHFTSFLRAKLFHELNPFQPEYT